MSDDAFEHPQDFEPAPLREVDADHLERAAALMPAAQRNLYAESYRCFLSALKPANEAALDHASIIGPSSQIVPDGIHALQFSLDNAELPDGITVLDSLMRNAHSNNDNCLRWLASETLLVEMRLHFKSWFNEDDTHAGLTQCWEGELFFSEDLALLRAFASRRTPFRTYNEYGHVVRSIGGADIAQSTLFRGFREYGDAVQTDDDVKLARALDNLKGASLACSHLIDPLWLAMQVNSATICTRVQELVDAGITVRADSLRFAIGQPHFSQVAKIVASGNANMNCRMIDGDTLLHAAVHVNDALAVQALLECGVDPSLTESTGATARQLATLKNGCEPIVSVFDAWAARQTIQSTLAQALGRSAANPHSHP